MTQEFKEEKDIEQTIVEETEDQEKTEAVDENERKELTAEEELRQQLDQKAKEAEDNWNSYLRSQADFDNFRRRTRQEREELLKYSGESLIENFLPIIDNFERALSSIEQQAPEVKQTLTGIEMIYRQIMQTFEQAGLTKIEAVGQEFDPKLHEAVMQEETEEHKDNTIIQELRCGYLFKDKVIRPSMVKVAKN